MVEAVSGALEGTAQVRRIAVDLATLDNPSADEIEAVDVSATLSIASRLAAPRLRDLATLSVDVGEVPPVAASASRLVQVFLNLISNAAQASVAGRTNEIVVTAEHDCTSVRISVSDSGRGIAKGDLEKVFEPFFTTRSAGGGTGLGLSICRRIIEACGGTLSIDSAPGRGTMVTVELAIAQARSEGVAPVNPVHALHSV